MHVRYSVKVFIYLFTACFLIDYIVCPVSPYGVISPLGAMGLGPGGWGKNLCCRRVGPPPSVGKHGREERMRKLVSLIEAPFLSM